MAKRIPVEKRRHTGRLRGAGNDVPQTLSLRITQWRQSQRTPGKAPDDRQTRRIPGKAAGSRPLPFGRQAVARRAEIRKRQQAKDPCTAPHGRLADQGFLGLGQGGSTASFIFGTGGRLVELLEENGECGCNQKNREDQQGRPALPVSVPRPPAHDGLFSLPGSEDSD